MLRDINLGRKCCDTSSFLKIGYRIIMYKRFLIFFMMVPMVMVAASCSGDSDDDGSQPVTDVITLSSKSLNFDGNAGSQTVTISTNHEWAASVSDSWISVTPNNSTNQNTTLTVSVQKNGEYDGREGTITIMAGAAREYISVKQAGGDGVPDPNAITCPIEGYKLVWNDEFDNGTSLDGAYWTHEVQGPGWVNNELQNYVKQQSPGGKKVTELKNGALRINCFKEDGKIYSGRVYANVNTGWQYGYFEAKIKLPKGKGTWPAFWMMPVGNDWSTNPWPMCGEIDIMEEVGVVPNEVSSSIHTQDYNHTKNTQKTHAMTIDKAEGEFHVYALEWTADAITTYVDGKVQLAVTKQQLGSGHNQWPFHYAFYPILNLAWGGDWGGMQGVDESALPVTMEVEYLRVFQKK